MKYNRVRQYLKCQIVKRKYRSGKKAAIMSIKVLRRLECIFNNKDVISQNDVVKTYGCMQHNILETLKKIKIKF